MIADAFNNRFGTRVSNTEAFARESVEERFAARRSVEKHVARDDVLRRLESDLRRGPHNHAAAREALTAVVVRIARYADLDALRQPSAEALPGGTGELDIDRAIREPLKTVFATELRTENRPNGSIDVLDREFDTNLLTAFKRRLGQLEKLHVDRFFEPMILTARVMHVVVKIRLVQKVGQVERRRLPMIDRLPHL